MRTVCVYVYVYVLIASSLSEKLLELKAKTGEAMKPLIAAQAGAAVLNEKEIDVLEEVVSDYEEEEDDDDEDEVEKKKKKKKKNASGQEENGGSGVAGVKRKVDSC